MDTDEGFPEKYKSLIVEHNGTLKGTTILFEMFKPIVTHIINTVEQVTEGVDFVVCSSTSLLIVDYVQIQFIHCRRI